jgi:hypothetical protein
MEFRLLESKVSKMEAAGGLSRTLGVEVGDSGDLSGLMKQLRKEIYALYVHTSTTPSFDLDIFSICNLI